MAQKPSIPKGTRDFSPLEMARRNYIFSTIRDVFTLYGFQQIETPAMENLSTLIGKYGEEGDKLLFKILNSGDYLKDAPQEFLDGRDSLHLTNKISEKGLRYDLTVPFARYVVQHRDEIQFPFRRYQIQPVWRADRPQRGRYREFYQCDADVVGSNSLLCEVELLAIINEVFSRLGINVEIHINNRKVLTGIAEVIGEPDKIIDITVAIDKIDKIGIEKVNDELRERGLKPQAIAALEPLLSLSGTNQEKLDTLRGLLAGSETGVLGINELEFVLENVGRLNLKSAVTLNVALARGLNYYTGTILEVKATDTPMGSISGGGRYDNLTGVFGVDGLSGVGISFGADRIYDVLNALNLYPQETTAATKIIFINFGEAVAEYSLQCAMQLRKAGISA
ncbi:MAG: histidine--tRNA ligase, partial [Muribaculaceae bacterium]|nr:histidine--tRNA ligase [Muribaculaceae bacterium]